MSWLLPEELLLLCLDDETGQCLLAPADCCSARPW